MATYGPLSGTGTQALSSGVGALHVHVDTVPSRAGLGNANPANYFAIGLIRVGDGTAWWTPVPIEALDFWMGVPNGSTIFGYSVFSGGVIHVTEVIGSNPFAGPQGLSAPTWSQLALVTLTANQTNLAIPSGKVWTDAPWSSVTFTVPSGTNLLSVRVSGVFVYGTLVDRLAVRSMLDTTADPPYQATLNFVNGDYASAPLTGVIDYWQPSAGSHTFKLQMACNSAMTVQMAPTTDPVNFSYRVRVLAQ